MNRNPSEVEQEYEALKYLRLRKGMSIQHMEALETLLNRYHGAMLLAIHHSQTPTQVRSTLESAL